LGSCEREEEERQGLLGVVKEKEGSVHAPLVR